LSEVTLDLSRVSFRPIKPFSSPTIIEPQLVDELTKIAGLSPSTQRTPHDSKTTCFVFDSRALLSVSPRLGLIRGSPRTVGVMCLLLRLCDDEELLHEIVEARFESSPSVCP